jgi:hypothetical protein
MVGEEVEVIHYARANSLESMDEKELAKLEKRFLWKLDVCLITWAWFAYCIKVGCRMRDVCSLGKKLMKADRLVELQDGVCVRDEGRCKSRAVVTEWQVNGH